jgi:hypothetical protein
VANEWRLRVSEPEEEEYLISITGVDDTNPTERYGRGVAVTRTAEGVYRMTWSTNPGTFLGIAGYCFGADTMSDVKGYTLTRDTYSASAGVYTLDVSVWNSSFAAADLIAAQYVDLVVRFKTGA